ncbi:hypothetical protein Z052_13855 [Halorubrum sp. C191]|nr:hypothetical protein Z052_13855 [Halorubrum sp. C191]
MSKANVHKHLTTLQIHGFVTRDGSAYRLGLRFFELGVTARGGGPLYQESAPKVVELAEITNQTATLLVPNCEAGVYVASVNPERESRSGELEGERRPLHETASGRAVLARYPKTERSELLSSAADSGELRDRLARIEEREVAVGEAPGRDDRRELAAPIVTGHRTPIGAVALLVD